MSSANENGVSGSSNNSREKTYKKVNCFSLIFSFVLFFNGEPIIIKYGFFVFFRMSVIFLFHFYMMYTFFLFFTFDLFIIGLSNF